MPPMALLPARLLAALFPLALGSTHKTIGGGRQTAVMTIFGLLPFESFDTLLESVDQPFEVFYTLLPRANGDDGLFEPFAQVLIRLVRLSQLFVFAMHCGTQGYVLLSSLFD